MRVNYIVAGYIGPVRPYPHYQKLFKNNPLYFFEKHFNFIKDFKTEELFTTFVFNDDIDIEIKNKLTEYTSENYEIIFRKNSGFSYGIWNDIITKNLNEFDYFFLIEDDYIPARRDFLDHFKKRCVDNVAFVCGLIDHASHQKYPLLVSKNESDFPFPSISNGLLSGEASLHVFNIHNTIFKINLNTDYGSAYENQILFCKHFTDLGYKIIDILDEFKSPYNNANAVDLVMYGKNDYDALITPIEVPRD